MKLAIMSPDSFDNALQEITKQKTREYEAAFKAHNYLDGFGEFTIFSEIADITQEANPQVDSGTYDAEFAKFYFAALGSTEADMFEYGCRKVGNKEDVPYSYVRSYLTERVRKHISDLRESPSMFLCDEPRFVQAWYDEMMRAAVRGLRTAGCAFRGLPAQYSERNSIAVSGAPAVGNLEQRIDSLEKGINEELEKSARQSSRFSKYVIAGIAGLYFIAAAAGIASVVFVQNAKKQLREKETELEKKVDDKIADVRYAFNSDLESNIWSIIGNALDTYAPNIDKTLPRQERLHAALKVLEENKKAELLETIRAEIGEINFWKLMQQSSDKQE